MLSRSQRSEFWVVTVPIFLSNYRFIFNVMVSCDNRIRLWITCHGHPNSISSSSISSHLNTENSCNPIYSQLILNSRLSSAIQSITILFIASQATLNLGLGVRKYIFVLKNSSIRRQKTSWKNVEK